MSTSSSFQGMKEMFGIIDAKNNISVDTKETVETPAVHEQVNTHDNDTQTSGYVIPSVNRNAEDMYVFDDILEKHNLPQLLAGKISSYKHNALDFKEDIIKNVLDGMEGVAEEIANYCTQQITDNARWVDTNPIIEREIAHQKKTFVQDLSNDAFDKVRKNYDVVNTFDTMAYKDTAFDLEDEHLIAAFYSNAKQFYKLNENKRQIESLTEEFLCDEVEIFIDDIANY